MSMLRWVAYLLMLLLCLGCCLGWRLQTKQPTKFRPANHSPYCVLGREQHEGAKQGSSILVPQRRIFSKLQNLQMHVPPPLLNKLGPCCSKMLSKQSEVVCLNEAAQLSYKSLAFVTMPCYTLRVYSRVSPSEAHCSSHVKPVRLPGSLRDVSKL